MKGNIKHRDEIRHHALVDTKMGNLHGKQALLSEWEQYGYKMGYAVYRPYVKELRLKINNLKNQLRAMGAME